MRELECNKALLAMALISGAHVSMPASELRTLRRMTVLIFTVTKISKNIISCNKLS